MAAPDSTTSRSGLGAGFNPGAILAFVCMGQFMVFTDVSIVNLALPSIQSGLDMSDVSLNYIVTAYATVLGGFLLLGGRLAVRAADGDALADLTLQPGDADHEELIEIGCRDRQEAHTLE